MTTATNADTAWSRNLRAATEYFQREGHLRVPKAHRENGVDICQWKSQLRYARRNGWLSQPEIDQLDAIGMPWETGASTGRRCLSPDQCNEIVRQYEAGSSIRALAVAFSCSYGTIHRVIEEAGVPFRKRGGANNSPDGAADRWAVRPPLTHAPGRTAHHQPTPLGSRRGL